MLFFVLKQLEILLKNKVVGNSRFWLDKRDFFDGSESEIFLKKYGICKCGYWPSHHVKNMPTPRIHIRFS